MGKPPAVVIIARHGARLDAVDKQWHLTSPTPYDPPLTYGGWTQARALGIRIASLLQDLEGFLWSPSPQRLGDFDAGEEAAKTITVKQDSQEKQTELPQKKLKIVIHSSPYLRCVQTSIAVSAGMSQQYWASNMSKSLNANLTEIGTVFDTNGSQDLSAACEGGAFDERRDPPRGIPKTCLRLDAFLGEWLSPDYFEEITPPPSSTMMVAGAKAELLRRGEMTNGACGFSEKPISGYFPGGWGSNVSISTPSSSDGGHSSMISNVLEPQERSRSSVDDQSVSSRGKFSKMSAVNYGGGYVPPIPTFAVSPSNPIPAGYVAHARDTCVSVDYQWDSMKEPQNWAGGGEYGEEWNAMHSRFQHGLQNIIDWYRTHDCPHSHYSNGNEDESSDDFTDTVLILVTHGAGCNALIGALTGKPVLLDISVASLTMAVRKDVVGWKDTSEITKVSGQQCETKQSRRFACDLSVPQEYEMKSVASTEHLRAGLNNTVISHLPSSGIQRSPSISAYRHRLKSREPRFIGSYEPPKLGETMAYSYDRRRAATMNARHLPRGGAGLWGSISSATREGFSGSGEKNSNDGEDNVSSFRHPKPKPISNGIPQQDGAYERPRTGDLSWTRSASERRPNGSQRGLWSSEESESIPKRRWTMTERH